MKPRMPEEMTDSELRSYAEKMVKSAGILFTNPSARVREILELCFRAKMESDRPAVEEYLDRTDLLRDESLGPLLWSVIFDYKVCEEVLARAVPFDDSKIEWKSEYLQSEVEEVDRKLRIQTILVQYSKKCNRYEKIEVYWWFRPYIYINVVDRRWPDPCGSRALVSFDLMNGLLASEKSEYRYAFARRGWGRFMDQLCGYKVQRYSDKPFSF